MIKKRVGVHFHIEKARCPLLSTPEFHRALQTRLFCWSKIANAAATIAVVTYDLDTTRTSGTLVSNHSLESVVHYDFHMRRVIALR